MKALLIIDVQNDFIPGGALEVAGGDQIIPVINKLQTKFDLVVATQDWHPQGHDSFASSHPGKKPFDVIDLDGIKQVLWPDHCVQGSPGAEFHLELNTKRVEAIFRKGINPRIDSYSGFYDNGHRKSTGLSGYLREKEVTEIFFCGLAADYCVYYSIKDAIKEGFSTALIEDSTKPIDAQQFEKIKIELTGNNCRLMKSHELM